MSDQADSRRRTGSSGVPRHAAGYACLYEPPAPETPAGGSCRASGALVSIAQEFSPRYERHRDDLVTIDVSGLERLMRPPVWKTIGEELCREAVDRGVRVHVALASTRTAALVLARARPGLTVVEPGGELAALAPLPLHVLEHAVPVAAGENVGRPQVARSAKHMLESALRTIEHWGVRTLGELAALPAADLVARLGRQGLEWQAIARGEDWRPLVPTLPEERFESTIDLEWPIEGLEPLSFVLTRLLEPLSIRLERRDRGVAVLQTALRLTTRELYVRRLQLPSPMRDVRTLRTLSLLDLESHPPAAAIDRVTVTIEPTPGPVLQHTLFTRPHPTPEQLSTLLARLTALMGQDRIGAAVAVNSYRPGAFEMKPFATVHAEAESLRSRPRDGESGWASGGGAPRELEKEAEGLRSRPRHTEAETARGDGVPLSALRRCRHVVPARVVAGAASRPQHVAVHRRGFTGGAVIGCAGPWRTSGCWWEAMDSREPRPESVGDGGACVRLGGGASLSRGRESTLEAEAQRSRVKHGGGAPCNKYWNRDEWDVALGDGTVYRLFRDCSTDTWFIDAIVD